MMKREGRRIKIFFVGEIISSHAQSWIDMMNEGSIFNIKALNIGPIFNSSPLPYHVAHAHKLPLQSHPFFGGFVRRLPSRLKDRFVVRRMNRLIKSFRPDIVHTLGIYPAAPFFAYFRGLIPETPWVMQARGGPDIALNRLDPSKNAELKQLLPQCDWFIADNKLNYAYAKELGVPEHKFAPFGTVPGTGGIEVENEPKIPPSRRERLVVWPKAYFCIQSDGLPVIEGIRRAWPHIRPCRVVATAATPEVAFWTKHLLGSEGIPIEIHERISRKSMLELTKEARVVLMPSLSDGIPNTLYEAMALGAVPIVSPLETLTGLFEDERHVLYAGNLCPDEIASALVRALNDDALADGIAMANLPYVRAIANRKSIGCQVRDFYRSIA